MNFEDDLAAAAELGWGAERFDRMAHMGMAPGSLAQFRDLDGDTRALVMRLLGGEGGPTDEDFRELDHHPAGAALAQWLQTLPAYFDDDESSDL